MTNANASLQSEGSSELEHVVLVNAPHPLLIREPQPREPIREVAINDLIARADEYVTVVNGVAIVAPAIKKVMSATEVQWVEHLVAIHNVTMPSQNVNVSVGGAQIRLQPQGAGVRPPALPHAGSQSGGSSSGDTPPTSSSTSSTSQAIGGSPPVPCTPNVTITFYWWGFRLYMDHCFCKLLTPIGSAAAGAGGVTAALLLAGFAGTNIAFAAGPYFALAASLIAAMVGWITWADGYCTPNSGANYNQSWTVQGWITTVC
jgi:hypothetical protein